MRKSFPAKLRRFGAVLVLSVLLGGFLTTLLEDLEITLLKPVRNLIYFGNTQAFSSTDIGPTKYKFGEGVNPVQIGQIVRDQALRVLESGPDDAGLRDPEINKIIEVADYYRSSAEDRSFSGTAFKVWTYKFDYPYYGLLNPWTSAMAQGHAIEVTLAAYKLTGDKAYFELAKSAADGLKVPVKEGGFSNEVGDGLWLEEYASPVGDSPYVLNGHNYTLNALWFLCKDAPDYCPLFERGVEALRVALPKYNATLWSRYDLAGTLANRHYQQVHVQQLRDLYERTRQPVFRRYQRIFWVQMYSPLGVYYRLVRVHNNFLLVVLGLNIGATFAAFSLISSAFRRAKIRSRSDSNNRLCAVDRAHSS